jgi:hypothetical protein
MVPFQSRKAVATTMMASFMLGANQAMVTEIEENPTCRKLRRNSHLAS